MLGFAWSLVKLGMFNEVEILFLVEGHTKMSCDRMFGSFTNRLGRRDYCSMLDIVSILNQSSYKATELPPGSFLDWTSQLGQLFHPIKGIKKYYSFRARREDQGSEVVKLIGKRIAASVEEKDLTNQLTRGSVTNEQIQSMFMRTSTVGTKALPEVVINGLRTAQQFFIDKIVQYAPPRG